MNKYFLLILLLPFSLESGRRRKGGNRIEGHTYMSATDKKELEAIHCPKTATNTEEDSLVGNTFGALALEGEKVEDPSITLRKAEQKRALQKAKEKERKVKERNATIPGMGGSTQEGPSEPQTSLSPATEKLTAQQAALLERQRQSKFNNVFQGLAVKGARSLVPQKNRKKKDDRGQGRGRGQRGRSRGRGRDNHNDGTQQTRRSQQSISMLEMVGLNPDQSTFKPTPKEKQRTVQLDRKERKSNFHGGGITLDPEFNAAFPSLEGEDKNLAQIRREEKERKEQEKEREKKLQHERVSHLKEQQKKYIYNGTDWVYRSKSAED